MINTQCIVLFFHRRVSVGLGFLAKFLEANGVIENRYIVLLRPHGHYPKLFFKNIFLAPLFRIHYVFKKEY